MSLGLHPGRLMAHAARPRPPAVTLCRRTTLSAGPSGPQCAEGQGLHSAGFKGHLRVRASHMGVVSGCEHDTALTDNEDRNE